MPNRHDNQSKAGNEQQTIFQAAEELLTEPKSPDLFRYRTRTLVGRWMESREEAVADAIRAGQAEPDPTQPDLCRWRIEGRIECSGERRH